MDRCISWNVIPVKLWKRESRMHGETQCSQRSGGPVGPCGGTAKSPGPDGTAKCSPHPSWKPQDGRLVEDSGPCKVRHFSVGEGRGLRGTTGDCGRLQGTTGPQSFHSSNEERNCRGALVILFLGGLRGTAGATVFGRRAWGNF